MTTQSKIAGVSPLLALMTAVDCHPVESVRQSAKRAVEESVGDSIIRKSQRAIEKLLHPFADDPLEPLVLSPTDLWMIAVIQADASKRRSSPNPILRIVGRDTFGASGGVRLQGCISAERLSRTNPRRTQATDSGAEIFFNDLHEWEDRATVTTTSRVTNHDTERGFDLIVDANVLRMPEAIEALAEKSAQINSAARAPSPPLSLSEAEQKLLSALQSESYILPSGIPLSRLGLRLERRPGQVALCSGSPESVIRSVAALMTPGVLFLQSTRILGVLLLGKGGEDVACFRCHDGIEPDWTTATLTSDPVINERLKYDIAHWCGPHSSWVTTDFLENIATNFEKSHD